MDPSHIRESVYYSLFTQRLTARLRTRTAVPSRVYILEQGKAELK
jgi:hypothetical protein